ncbi:MAG: 4Fe-4S dicluster domain-containing protein, partial [Prevotellaceae bacterium]|nr:4Fe-4S dicluster domain-containing protein [Prevotellaceae bacterium]
MEQKFIPKETLKALLAQLLSDGHRVLAPVEADNGKLSFERVSSADSISLKHVQTTQSVKKVAFPRTEKLFSYAKQQGKLELSDYDADALPPTIVFGLHPCDAAGFAPLSAIFNWDVSDLPFNERMKRTTLITLSCTAADEYCFCTSVGGHPGSASGSDMLLTPLADGYLVEVATDKGQQLAERYASLLQPAPANASKDAALAEVSVRFNLDELKKKMATMFGSEAWLTQSSRCIGCGSCAFVCPTCACFDVQENARTLSHGDRLRCWDSCGLSLFTLHTSGHNPRPTQHARWRQRLMHKFAYMPQRLGVHGCTGCGRCSRACPVDMNLAEHLASV